MHPLVKEPGQAGVSAPVPIPPVPFYLRDVRREMFAAVEFRVGCDGGNGLAVGRDEETEGWATEQVKLPVQSASTE